jgi:hypothetical protein
MLDNSRQIDWETWEDVTYATGKFQGTSAAATPIGCLTVKTLLPGVVGVAIVPLILSASPANHHVKPNE